MDRRTVLLMGTGLGLVCGVVAVAAYEATTVSQSGPAQPDPGSSQRQDLVRQIADARLAIASEQTRQATLQRTLNTLR